MKLKTVREIQSQVESIIPIVNSFIKIYDRTDLKALLICFENIKHNSEHCVNYSLERDSEKIKNILELCKAMQNKIYADPTLDYILEEFILMVEGCIMSLEYDFD